MGIGPLRLASLLASILVGVAAGLLAADMREPVEPADTSGADPSEPAQTADPLGIDVTFENLGCTGESIIVLQTGDTGPAIRAGMADFPEARYLRIAKSCDTFYWDPADDPGDPPPKFAAYLGPMDTMDEACEKRTSARHRRHYATRLRSGNQDPIKCWCVLPSSAWPVLEPGITPNAREGLAIRQLQSALIDLGRLSDEGWPSGEYDQATIEQVNELAATADEEANGVADAQTWAIIARRVCGNYDF